MRRSSILYSVALVKICRLVVFFDYFLDYLYAFVTCLSAVIALATLLGLCILIIIGLVINTIRIEVQSHKKEVIQSVQLENNHEGMRVSAIISIAISAKKMIYLICVIYW